MSIKQKQALGGLVALWLAGMVAYLENQHLSGPADGCPVCDCSGAVVALPGAVTPVADVSAVTAVTE
jgi:hypothetical protein